MLLWRGRFPRPPLGELCGPVTVSQEEQTVQGISCDVRSQATEAGTMGSRPHSWHSQVPGLPALGAVEEDIHLLG